VAQKASKSDIFLLPVYMRVCTLYILLTAIGFMPGGSVYKDPTFNKETAQYIARIFTVEYTYMNVSTIQILYEYYKTQKKTEKNTRKLSC
jgi:hypothetical protein